jgi:hypothetical protein
MKVEKPIFIKGHLEFSVDGHRIAFQDKAISLNGVTGLPWSPLSPKKHFGTSTIAQVTLPQANGAKFQVAATLTREQTLAHQYMGLRFGLDPASHRALSVVIEKHGFYPNDYIRKYPRIPSALSIQTYPLRVLAGPTHDSEMSPIVFDVRNISLGGLLLSTENPFALSILPGTLMELYLEPRGDFSIQVHMQATVRRIFDEKDVASKNLTRLMGLQFTRVDEENRNSYLELMKDILLKLKA